MNFDGPPSLYNEEVALISRWIREGARNEQGQRSPVPVSEEVRYEGRLTGRWAVDEIPFTSWAKPMCAIRRASATVSTCGP
jgi:hypothetical protein